MGSVLTIVVVVGITSVSVVPEITVVIGTVSVKDTGAFWLTEPKEYPPNAATTIRITTTIEAT